MLRLVLALAFCGAVFCPSSAEAGAWTKRKGEGLAIVALGYHWLDPYAQSDAISTMKIETSIYLEYGIMDRLTLVGRGGYQQLHDRDGSGQSATRSGFGGLEVGARLRLLEKGRWASALQITAGIPGSGENWINEDFGARGGDLDTRLQLGRSIGDGGFVSVASGLRLRGEGAADEMRFDLTAGTDFFWGTRVMVQSYSVWALGGTPAQPAYTGHRMQTSLLIPFGRNDRNTVQLSALRSVNQQRMSEEFAVLASIWRSF